jgi:hypothetical protein
MSHLASDQLMATLVEMGVASPRAHAYSQAYATVEAAIEALLRDEANNATMPGAGSPVPAVGSVAHATALSQLSSSSEERKEIDLVPEVLEPTAWREWKEDSTTQGETGEIGDGETLPSSSPESGDSSDIPIDVIDDSPQVTSSYSFEVLHASITSMSSTVLSGWSTRKLHSAFLNAELRDRRSSRTASFCSDIASTTKLGGESELEGDKAMVESLPRSMSFSSNCITPRQEELEQEDEACNICYDAEKVRQKLRAAHA